jgi:uncharacterized protein (TIGR00730 family)
MTKEHEQLPLFPSAAEDLRCATQCDSQHSSYQLAYADEDFMLKDELRSVRLQLEWMKPELIQAEHGIESTVVIFGGARFGLDNKNKNHQPKHSEYYHSARRLSNMITEYSLMLGGSRYVVATGGGPGIMEAANRGAHDLGGKTIGLNIVLPFEQKPNPYITPELCFQFHYFAIRKMHFLKRARALIAYPGGFGTLDELFEALTLVQTKKVKPLPIVLMGRDYWRKLIDFEFLVEQGAISPSDIDLFHYCDDEVEAFEFLKARW